MGIWEPEAAKRPLFAVLLAEHMKYDIVEDGPLAGPIALSGPEPHARIITPQHSYAQLQEFLIGH